MDDFETCISCRYSSEKNKCNKIFCGKKKQLKNNCCIICNINLGDSNPRQLCCKTYCENS